MSVCGGSVSPFDQRDDRGDDLHAHPVGKLDRVGVDLAVADRLLSLGLAVEADDPDLVRLARLFQGGAGAERRRIVDGEHAAEFGMRLQRVLASP